MENREELLQALVEKMTSVMKSMHTGHSFLFGDFELSRFQVMILFFIAKNDEGVSAKDLAKFLNVTPGAVTQLIDILVKKKFVQREENTKDRRVTKIKLTSSARSKLTLFKKKYYQSMSSIFNAFDQKEIQQFHSFLNKIKVKAE